MRKQFMRSVRRKSPKKLAKRFAKSKLNDFTLGIRSRLERLRWPNGPICPHCGSTGDSIASIRRRTPQSSTADGLYYCNDCGGKFTVTVGTVLQRSHVHLGAWVAAVALISRGLPTREVQLELGVDHKTAERLAARISAARREGEDDVEHLLKRLLSTPPKPATRKLTSKGTRTPAQRNGRR